MHVVGFIIRIYCRQFGINNALKEMYKGNLLNLEFKESV